jgi:hypothetical protein
MSTSLRNSPRGDMSKTATLAVTTFTNLKKILFFISISSETSHVITAMVAAFDVSPLGLSRNVTTRF